MLINKNKFFDEFRAMILCAGLGTRFKPLTEFIPKPLVPICGRALLLRILDKIFSCGASGVAVNLHYKGRKIVNAVNKEYHGMVYFSYEKKILGTGGGILKCKDFLCEKKIFLLHNGDVISLLNLNKLIEFHLKSGLLGTLLLVNGDDNKISLERGKILGIKAYCDCENRNLYTYAGIAVFNREIFNYFPKGKEAFPLIEVFAKAIEYGALGGYAPDNIYWRDVGSIEKYFSVHEELFNEPVFRKTARCPSGNDYKVSGFISLPESGNYIIGKGAKLHNCIIMDGGRISQGEVRSNEIIGKNYSIHRDTATIKSLPFFRSCDFRKIRISSLQEQGSNRKFYRIKAGAGKTRVLMISSSDDIDFNRFIKLGRYFKREQVSVPKIFKVSFKARSVLMEDLGDTTLNLAIKSGSNRYFLLKKAIDFLLGFQYKTFSTAKRNVRREFGFEGLRWESDYFMNNFVAKFAGLTPGKFYGIDTEFDMIAREALACPQLLCHRDFQSQNIMLRNGSVISIVDFQGARIGPFTYDLMSLLRDAYIELTEEEISKLSKYYYERFSIVFSGLVPAISEDEFAKFATLSAVQRMMQALGAFAYLGLVKGKKFYLDFIPRAFWNLEKVFGDLYHYYPSKLEQFSGLLKCIKGKLTN